MNPNICPHCGKEVMPYKRFLKEAEPFKISACGNCNTPLKRSPRVFLYLVGMMIALAVIAGPLVALLKSSHANGYVIWGLLILLLAFWVILTNYLSWRYIGWVPVNKSP
ncbi:MAG: hypothetical protein WCW40_02740 [Bacteroidota bacterium]